MRSLSIEIKIIIGIVLFTIFIVGAERYQLSDNIMNQFIKSKKSKNTLLIDTISPIIALNISLGLDSSNQEYLEQVIKQNSDIEFLNLTDTNKETIFTYTKNLKQVIKKGTKNVNFSSKNIIDSISGAQLGFIYIFFSNKEFEEVRKKNMQTTITISAFTLFLLFFFILLIKGELRELKNLSKDVLNYDPKLNNLTLTKSNRLDEVGVIHNAIMSMIQKISSHAKDLDEINLYKMLCLIG